MKIMINFHSFQIAVFFTHFVNVCNCISNLVLLRAFTSRVFQLILFSGAPRKREARARGRSPIAK